MRLDLINTSQPCRCLMRFNDLCQDYYWPSNTSLKSYFSIIWKNVSPGLTKPNSDRACASIALNRLLISITSACSRSFLFRNFLFCSVNSLSVEFRANRSRTLFFPAHIAYCKSTKSNKRIPISTLLDIHFYPLNLEDFEIILSIFYMSKPA